MRRLLVLTALAAALTAGAQQRIVRLWNNASAPHDNGLRGGERVEEDRLFNTTEAVLYVYAADPARATGQAAVVCPGGGYRFLFALEIWKLETTLFLVLLPVPAQIQKHLVPGNKIAHVCNPFSPSRLKSRPTRNYHLQPQARGESTKAPVPHISLRTCPLRTRFCIRESERACRRSRP